MINGEVIGADEELTVRCPFENWDDASDTYFNGCFFVKYNISDIRVSESGLAQLPYDDGCGAWGTPSIHWSSDFTARRSFSTMVA